MANVFRHFPTKGELVEAVLIRHFARVTDQARSLAQAAAAMPVPAETLRRAADIILAGLTSLVDN